GEPRLGTTATYMRHNDHGTTRLSTEIDRLHDRRDNEYRIFSAGSVRVWSKFGLGGTASMPVREKGPRAAGSWPARPVSRPRSRADWCKPPASHPASAEGTGETDSPLEGGGFELPVPRDRPALNNTPKPSQTYLKFPDQTAWVSLSVG